MLKDAARIKSSIEGVARGLYEDEQSVHAPGHRVLGAPQAVFRHRVDGCAQEEDGRHLFRRGRHRRGRSGSRRSRSITSRASWKALEERLSTIVRLKEKYGKTYGGIAEFEDWARKRLDELLHLKTDAAGAGIGEGVPRGRRRRDGGRAVGGRRSGAREIEELVTEELAFLSMKGVRFKVEIADKGWIGEDGRDEVEFLLTTNPGEPLRPLRRVASGGELSRIMLAIKKITGGEEEKTFVFDEIDAGIGGRVAEVVGRRLRELSGKHQIICITHLPQIAVYGDHHFLVEKHQEDGGDPHLDQAVGRSGADR